MQFWFEYWKVSIVIDSTTMWLGHAEETFYPNQRLPPEVLHTTRSASSLVDIILETHNRFRTRRISAQLFSQKNLGLENTRN